MAERIAVFIGQVNQEYQIDMMCSIEKAAKELGYKMDVFSEFGSYGENFLHAEGERNIINLPYVEDYAGVIIAPDTFGVADMEKLLDIKLLAKMSGPVVSIRQEKDCFFSVMIDNRAAMARMVEHFVKVHGFRKIFFMKGREDLKDAADRYQGYLDIMEKYDIPVTEHMVFNGNYWRNLGKQAVDWFLGGEEKTEAIVCANDFMACSVLDELKHRGIRVPEDIAVSGFDDIEESRYLSPGLCSVSMPCEEMGKEAVRLIHKVTHGGKSPQIVRLPVEFAYRKSCGCGGDESRHWTEILYSQKLYLNNVIAWNSFMNRDYDNYDTMEELLNGAYQFSRQFQYKNLYICLCDRADEDGGMTQEVDTYTEKMVLRAVMNYEEGVQLMEEEFMKRLILPEKYRKQQEIAYFFPLHHKNHCLGYLIVETDQISNLREFFNCWVIELSSCMDKVLLYEENKSLQEFRRLSTVDDLTGLYNRRKLEQELSKKLSTLRTQPTDFFIISLDMDGLKTINDTYGHLEGDAALKAFANVLQQSVGERDLCCRVGGDEFTILVDGKDEGRVKAICRKIDEAVDAFNAEKTKPYELAGSMGYAEYRKNENLTNCIKRADINMYADKVARKKVRMS